MRGSEKVIKFSLSQGVDASWPRGGAGRKRLIRLQGFGLEGGEAASGGRASSLLGFDRLRGKRRRGARDLPEPSGEGGEGGCSEAAIGGAAPGRRVASDWREPVLPGILNEGRPPGEERKSSGARAGSFGSLAEHGGRNSTWRRGNWPHSGRESVPTQAAQLANITWDTFFVFRALIPSQLGFLPVQ